jgi:GST-like protein
MDLYHWEPNGACANVMIALKEKGLDFTSHYVDVLAFEQHTAEILKLNPSGEVPILVDKGEAMAESNYTNEYLEEAYPQTALMPKDRLERWEVRVWQKMVDDYVGACTSEIAWEAIEAKAFRNRDKAETEKKIAAIPMKERRDLWLSYLNGIDEERLARSTERMADIVKKMETDLQKTGWLAGSAYSLADISVFSYVSYLPRVMPDVAGPSAAPNTTAWLKKINDRPAVKAALAMGKRQDPFGCAAPGPEQVRWG